RHHDDGGLAIARVVPGEQPAPVGAVPRDEVAELLVRERLQRRGIERFPAALEREPDAELADDSLPRSRRRAHEHAPALDEAVVRLQLEVVERKWICACERGLETQDRKSTRLNSSHVKISYA